MSALINIQIPIPTGSQYFRQNHYFSFYLSAITTSYNEILLTPLIFSAPQESQDDQDDQESWQDDQDVQDDQDELSQNHKIAQNRKYHKI